MLGLTTHHPHLPDGVGVAHHAETEHGAIDLRREEHGRVLELQLYDGAGLDSLQVLV